ncbi:hypothetical protein [uncultured Chryseobacterium sp.]|uniref:hypothetical protein n=1 Tax=uncultured Chryseobacterium sp. TaxID=259322 RepID=UPI0025D6B7F6|nr:hypothetical protein [uncultured Chryseobacterium sp.]
MKKRLFLNKWVYVISLMLATFTCFLYQAGVYLQTLNPHKDFVPIAGMSSMAILSGFQVYFLIRKDRKAIVMTNIHLGILLCIMVYGLVSNLIDLIRFKIYINDTNGILFGVAFLVLSLYIVNKFKVSEMRYEDINEIGRKHE